MNIKRFLYCTIIGSLSLCGFAQTTEHILPQAEQLFSDADSLRIERKYGDAYKAAYEAEDIYKDVFGKESAEYGVAKGRTAEFIFWLSGNWKPSLLEGLYIVSTTKGTQCDEYARLLTIYARYALLGGDSLQRMDFAHQAVEIRRKVLGPEHPDYAWSLTQEGDCFYDAQQYDKAIRILHEAVSILRKYEATHARKLGNALDLLYKAYRRNGKHEEGLATLAELLEVEKRVLGRNHDATMKTMRQLTDYYKEQGRELEAYRLQEEQNEIMNQNHSEQHRFVHIRPLTRLAMSHEKRGHFDLAIPLYEQVYGICANELKDSKASFMDSIWVAQAASNLAFAYERAGQYISAINAANKAAGIWEDMGLNKDTTFVDLVNLFAICHYRLGMEGYAIAFAKRGLSILDSNPDMGCLNSTYVTALRILSWIEPAEEAVQYSRRALDILRQLGEQDSRDYAYCQRELAKQLLYTDQADEAMLLYESSLNNLRQSILTNFASQSVQERQATWRKLQHIFYDKYPEFCYTYHVTKKHIEDASNLYNYSALFAKGLMLATETGLSEQIHRAGNAAFAARYDSLLIMRAQLNHLYDNPDAQRVEQAEKLSRQIEQGEKELVLMLKVSGNNYTKLLQTDWHDVQRALGPSDIAVEFITFHMDLIDTDVTLALTLRKDDDYPRMKPIFDSWGLQNAFEDSSYNDENLYSVVWGVLGDRLNGIRNIYFSPSGPLHNLSIENLPGCEMYNFYRLSSTRELVQRSQPAKKQNAVFYGGLMYNVDMADMEAESQVYKQGGTSTNLAYNSRSIADSLQVRGAMEGTPYLKGTATEVNAIAHLVEKKMNTSVFMGIKGNEESFKALSGKNVQVVHIATHGFYWTEEVIKDSESLPELNSDMPRRSAEDKALSRSGLLMAGADNALGGDISENVEDGLLTAQEIAQLDLGSLDLTVLSACETALGDVRKSEGVFGLQRGFKKAGAKSILMSLWKVDDEATCLLMTEFYKNWIAQKMTKHDALEAAKQTVRSHKEKGWDDPKFWAAFILLDGLD